MSVVVVNTPLVLAVYACGDHMPNRFGPGLQRKWVYPPELLIVAERVAVVMPMFVAVRAVTCGMSRSRLA